MPRGRDSNNAPRSEWHTTGVGTASYASPEQLQGRRRYGVRSDLFSLGLVLLELCCCFTTTHERADAFQSMRRPDGAAPKHLARRSPAVAELAELLCRTVPEQRPSAEEMLERLDALDGRCGCEGCPGGVWGSGGDRRGGRSGSGDLSGAGGGYPDDAGLREELAAKTRKVEEQVRSLVLILFLLSSVSMCTPWYRRVSMHTGAPVSFDPSCVDVTGCCFRSAAVLFRQMKSEVRVSLLFTCCVALRIFPVSAAVTQMLPLPTPIVCPSF